MAVKWFAGGIVVILVALGFVFPQVAELRINQAISPGGMLLLLLGVAGTIGGAWCVLRSFKRESATPQP